MWEVWVDSERRLHEAEIALHRRDGEVPRSRRASPLALLRRLIPSRPGWRRLPASSPLRIDTRTRPVL